MASSTRSKRSAASAATHELLSAATPAKVAKLNGAESVKNKKAAHGGPKKILV